MNGAPVPRLVFRRTPENRNSLAPLRVSLAPLVRSGRLVSEIAATLPGDLGPNDVLACSFTTLHLDSVAREISRFAKVFPRPLLIAGGCHPSADPEGTLALGFDAVFVGEAERTLPTFAARWIDRPDRRAVAASPVIRDEAGPFEIDSIAHADADTAEFPFVEIARGCPHACAFCQVSSLHGRRPRFRSPATAAMGIAPAVARGHRRFRFLTPDAFAYRPDADRDPAECLLALIGASRAAGASTLMLGGFPSEVRPDHVTADLLSLVAAQCSNRTVVIGAQSGCDEVLRAMNRGHTAEDSRRAIRLVVEAGLVPHVDLMFGFPNESAASRRRTLELGREVLALERSRLHLHAYLPLPGTAAWPAPPEPLEPDLVRELRDLATSGRVDGYWEQQIAQGRLIVRQAREGLIRSR